MTQKPSVTPYVRPDVRGFLDMVAAIGAAPFEVMGVAAAREAMDRTQVLIGATRGDIARVADVTVPGPAGAIPARLYDARATIAPAPMMIFYHGGGWTVGSLDSYDALCAQIARASQLPLLSVDYRMAPEAPFPAAADDAEAVARWIADHPDAFDLSTTGLVLAGDSAGGNLTIITAQALAAKPAALPILAQWPIYPATMRNRVGSIIEFAEGYLLSRATMDWFYDQYAAPADHPRFNAFVADAGATPPTVLTLASLDPLRDEGRAYAAHLATAGVPLCVHEAQGTVHGFLSLIAAMPSGAEDLSLSITMLRQMIAPHMSGSD